MTQLACSGVPKLLALVLNAKDLLGTKSVQYHFMEQFAIKTTTWEYLSVFKDAHDT